MLNVKGTFFKKIIFVNENYFIKKKGENIMKMKRINYFRLALQWIILALLAYMVIRPFVDTAYTADFEAYCPLGGLQALSGYLVTNNLACSMTSMQITMGIALIVCILIFSKLFCSYICPVGTFTEWLGKLGEKFKMRYTIKGIADRSLRILKYVLLFLTFYFTIKGISKNSTNRINQRIKIL